MKTRDFKEDLLKDLQDPGFAISYLTDAVEEKDVEGFLLAVRDVIEARGGIGPFSAEIENMHRVSLYKALSRNGNPLFSTMIEILNSLGIGLRPYIRDEEAFLLTQKRDTRIK